MSQNTFTLYKLIILYMLEKVNFPLTQAQVSTFILDKGYTHYLTVQQAIAELTETGLITKKKNANRTQLIITKEGKETINYFDNEISDAIKEDIRVFFKENKMDLREEYSITSNYDKAINGEYEAYLSAKDNGNELLSIKISVPTQDMAEDVCANWQKRNQDIYKKLTELLF